jgi:two-component system, sensor histidine kinase
VLSAISLQDKWNRLYAKHQRGTLSLDEKLNMLLQTGVDAFNMEIGVISHIHNQNYTILYSTQPRSVCMQYSLHRTYCELSLKLKDVFAIHNASESQQNHPARLRFGVEAYFGIPLRIHGRVYGTMAFIKGQAKTPFSEAEKTLLRQLALKAESILEAALAEN